MPEIRIRKVPPSKEATLTVVNDKGGIFLEQCELEYVWFAEREYAKMQAFLKKKLHSHGKAL